MALRSTAPKKTSPWVVGATIAGVTATIIGAMAYLIERNDQKQAAILASINEAVNENTAAISVLTDDFHQLGVTFAHLNGNLKALNRSVEDVVVNAKGPPAGIRHFTAPAKPSSE